MACHTIISLFLDNSSQMSVEITILKEIEPDITTVSFSDIIGVLAPPSSVMHSQIMNILGPYSKKYCRMCMVC